ncbi:ECF-type sigma factor [Acanthopleuribacter pedis]|uniref:Sigma-70 family RNA polymerase sigma factor n=1 Tax=Acanthopleuribacter pedis TaxID=442870 RepID=A0A8J7Q809_9BACT|nr:ECF-type sigma factor [Acanthopleuribacter pedis]MBO1322417.1 sigma-70 family RNA polymerase sigma factor [Acanthopleuribacter pedis]
MNHTTRPRPGDSGPVTLWLQRWYHGDREAFDRLVALLYTPLKQRARRYLTPEATFSATALINEWYLRVAGSTAPTLNNRDHFLAVAALNLRRLAGHLRRRARGHARRRADQSVPTFAASSPVRPTRRRALDQALQRLAQRDPRCARVFVMRHLFGLTQAEVVRQTGLSPATIKRELAFARAWLAAQVGVSHGGPRV